MPYSAQVLRILIASPDDVQEERGLVVKAIQEWNDINSPDRHLVLLPVRWETHAIPQYGKRPQEVINRELVDKCDLVVGIFWTKLGSPTGEAASGTIEEIERAASANKPIMLFFSKAKEELDSLDLEQVRRLRDFRTALKEKALIEFYTSTLDFRDKFGKKLDLQIKQIVANASHGSADSGASSPYADIAFSFADLETGADVGLVSEVKTVHVDVVDFDKAPDLGAGESKGDVSGKMGGVPLGLLGGKIGVNKDYYRQRIALMCARVFYTPLKFYLKNRGTIGARDVFVQFFVECTEDRLSMIRTNTLPSGQPSRDILGYTGDSFYAHPKDYFATPLKRCIGEFEVSALQPQREISPGVGYLIGATESCTTTVVARSGFKTV